MLSRQKVTLTESQQHVYDGVRLFLMSKFVADEPTSYIITITGHAGTGKTFITKQILNYARSQLKQNVVAVAPTHKARRVLDKILNHRSFIPIKTLTVASLLSKLKGFSYVGTNRFEGGDDDKVKMYDVLVIDEVSMVPDKDYDKICQLGKRYGKKLIFIGDNAQIPGPSQPLSVINGELVKTDSKAFMVSNLLSLDQVVRQANNNPLHDIYALFRQDLHYEITVPRLSKVNMVDNEAEGVIFLKNHNRFMSMIKEAVKSWVSRNQLEGLRDQRVICYTNDAVKKYNQRIREFICQEQSINEPFLTGEILMGYTNIKGVLENGQDYQVVSARQVTNHVISIPDASFSGLSGQLVRIKECDFYSECYRFFPDLLDEGNYGLLDELINRAEKVNKKGSTRRDWARYYELRGQISFLEPVFRFQGRIMSHSNFQSSHPLLFTRVCDVIEEETNTRVIVETQLTQKIEAKYGTTDSLLEYRAADDKIIGDSELLADRFMIFDKDMDYGYAITTHKAQGSTFQTVFIDETNFKKLHNSWNPRFRMKENRIKERNQLLYVAYSRPKKLAVVYYTD